jgi:hypothetical protein
MKNIIRLKRILELSEINKCGCNQAEFIYDILTEPFSKIMGKDLYPNIIKQLKLLKNNNNH